MPIIPRVGRKALRIRLLIGCLYVVLSLGAVTMVYPFLLMLATSITSSTDVNEYRVIPRYLTGESSLFTKYVDEKYMGDIELINALYHTDFKKAEKVEPPAITETDRKLVEAWRKFVPTLPLDFKVAGFRGYGLHPSTLSRGYRAFVQKQFNGDLLAMNRAYVEEHESFQTVAPPLERMNKRNWSPDPSRKMQDFVAWKATLPEEMKPVFSVEGLFAKYLREDVAEYGGDIQKASAVWYARRAFDDVELPAAPPTDPAQLRDWEGFVRSKLPFRYIALAPEAVTPYREFLQRRHETVEKLNEAYGASYRSFDAVEMPRSIPDSGALNVDWGEFIANVVPTEMLHVDSPENRFRAHVAQNAPDVAAASAGAVRPPYYLADALYVHENAGDLRQSFMGRNYRLVFDYIVLHGRSLLVTAIFCLAVIATTLIVNPLCAYALSRYSLPYAHRVLLFLLATMAFPAEVAMIPNFLLLKQFGLLNTYWALILPGMASGFSIFLLKGFFDSLPKELYEAGTIDGASESRMFFRITIPLSKPIFAVIALQAFTAAYGAFMFALLVCQDPKMWTIMVWLYELQINNPQYVMMAGLAVAALPTLLVFVFAQNVIMRGIILPTEK